MRDQRRLPTPAFIVGFGALLIICVVLTVGVFSYQSGAEERAASATATTSRTGTSSSSTTTTPVTTVTGPGENDTVTVTREPKPEPVGTDEGQVRASIREHLIADAATARTYTGVAVTGAITEEALLSMPELTGHLSRLLEQNCVDSLGLRTPDNTRVSFVGFCYTTLPPETIQRMLAFALDGKADAIDFANNPQRARKTHVTMTWFADSAEKAERIQKSWNPLRKPRAIEQITLFTYTDEEVVRVNKARGKADSERRDPMMAEEYGS